VVALRWRLRRNFLSTLFLSLGVPMLLAGDELGHTQNGNNNAYSQDSELSWLDWKNTDKDLLEFARRIIAFRKAHPVFRRRKWYQGRSIRGSEVDDIAWFRPDSKLMSDEDWGNGFAKSLTVFLNGEVIPTPDQFGRRIIDSSFFLIFNAHWEAVTFTLPGDKWGKNWHREISTDDLSEADGDAKVIVADSTILVEPRSLVVLSRIAG
jgi:isoamylase